jgi:hypothetical protein
MMFHGGSTVSPCHAEPIPGIYVPIPPSMNEGEPPGG